MSNAFINNGLKAAQYDGITEHSLFQGGINGARAAMEFYNPLVTNFHRIVWTRLPKFVEQLFAVDGEGKYSKKSLAIQFKHIMEYMCVSLSGIPDFQLDFDDMVGGHAGNTISFPTRANWAAAQPQVTLYELSGGLIDRVVKQCWMKQIYDQQSGLMTLGGLVATDPNKNPLMLPEGAQLGTNNDGIGLAVNPASWSGEFMYIQTDVTGLQAEQAYYFSNVVPATCTINRDYAGGNNHDFAQANITFRAYCTQSTIVNALADKYLKKYYIASNSANWNPLLGDALEADGTLKTDVFGNVPQERSFGTSLGNRPVFQYTPQSPSAQLRTYNLNEIVDTINDDAVKTNPIYAGYDQLEKKPE